MATVRSPSPHLPRPALAAGLAAGLALVGGCAALRLPPQDDPDRSRHSYEVQGEVRRADTLAVVPGAAITVEGAREVTGDERADATGRFWLRVTGITPSPSAKGVDGPAGTVLVAARLGQLCAPATRVTLPAGGPVVLLASVGCPAP
jgi:hypothetical protein